MIFGKLAVVFFVICVHQSLTLKPPSYVKVCSRNDPKLSECSTRAAKIAIPGFLKGDRKYRIPNLVPFTITELKIDENIGLKIDLNDGLAYGLDKVKVKEIKVDLENKKFEWSLVLPRLMFLSKYNVSGRILILPITGRGDANITMDNLDFTYKFSYDIVKKGPKKEEYMKPRRGNIDYTMSRCYIRLENLFNGDKLLGPQMNYFLNENWKEASREVGPSIAKAIAEIIHSILSGLCELVPYNEIFPPK